jgi:hypothetical protein
MREKIQPGQIAELRQLLAQARPRVEALDLKAFARACLQCLPALLDEVEAGRRQGLLVQTQEEVRAAQILRTAQETGQAALLTPDDLQALKLGYAAVSARVRRLSAEAVEAGLSAKMKIGELENQIAKLKIAMLTAGQRSG